MGNLNQLNNLLKHHLSQKSLYTDEKCWRVQESAIDGRGIFANRDIKPGEIIFIDHPILIGPRAGTNYTYHCVVCYEINNIRVCPKSCGLPICAQCEHEHTKDCDLINKLYKNGKKQTEMCADLFRSLTPLRSLLLDENSRELIKCLACHEGKIHGFEVDLVKQYLTLNEQDEQFMKMVCSVLDSNAFASVIPVNSTQISIRGLYPLSSLLNHCCNPNTTHLFTKDNQMVVKAAVFIPKDCEIFTTYTLLLWGTTLRRHTQYVTKHFWCNCDRCKDTREFGACLSGLKCISDECQGVIYPLDPLKNSSKWKCDICGDLVSSQKVGMMQSALGSLLRSVCISEAEHLIILIRDRLHKVVPLKNHIAYELKLKVIWALGHNERYIWNDLTMDQLDFKEQICLDVLQVLQELKLGMCKMRGLLLFELYRTRFEKCTRSTKDFRIIEKFKQENKQFLKEATVILENDITAPMELYEFVNKHSKIIST